LPYTIPKTEKGRVLFLFMMSELKSSLWAFGGLSDEEPEEKEFGATEEAEETPKGDEEGGEEEEL
jgi:hypothetical protein